VGSPYSQEGEIPAGDSAVEICPLSFLNCRKHGFSRYEAFGTRLLLREAAVVVNTYGDAKQRKRVGGGTNVKMAALT
jgi:hypothetical protein